MATASPSQNCSTLAADLCADCAVERFCAQLRHKEPEQFDRLRDPNRKGTVENAIGHTLATAFKGRRFETIEEQNTFLA